MSGGIERALPVSKYRGELKQFGPKPIECHVLDDDRAVIAATDIELLIFTAKTGDLRRSIARIAGNSLPPREIRFRIPGLGPVVTGYEADVVIDLCREYVDRLGRGELHPKQMPVAVRASVILAACAKVGITALVHEATGYQEHRAKNALQDKLAAVLMQEAGRWRQLFSREFFMQMAKLYRIHLTSPNRRPGCFAGFIKEFFYEWFDEDVYAELRKRNPKPSDGTKHHQYLTPFARERFERHQRDVLILMRASSDIEDFRMRFGAAFRGTGLQLSF